MIYRDIIINLNIFPGNYLFFQSAGEQRIRIGKSSSLPASMSNIKTILDKMENEA